MHDGRRLRRLQRLSRDPDLQDARARWPLSPCGTTTNSRGKVGRASSRPAVSRGPARASRSPRTRPGGISAIALQEGQRTLVRKLRCARGENVAIEKWDENGLGDEPNNLAAIKA